MTNYNYPWDNYIPPTPITRKNSDFSTAARYGKLLRMAVNGIMVADSMVVSRLVKIIYGMLSMDVDNEPGKKTIKKESLHKLHPFAFNKMAELHLIFHVEIASAFNRALGQISVKFDSFIPTHQFYRYGSATHFQIVSAGCEIDFLNGTYISDIRKSPFLPLDNQSMLPLEVVHSVTQNSIHPLFLMIGIGFYQGIDSQQTRLLRMNLNPFMIWDVNGL